MAQTQNNEIEIKKGYIAPIFYCGEPVYLENQHVKILVLNTNLRYHCEICHDLSYNFPIFIKVSLIWPKGKEECILTTFQVKKIFLPGIKVIISSQHSHTF